MADSPFDFREGRPCEQALAIDGGGKPGLDHCFCLDGYKEGALELKEAASLYDKESGRLLRVFTTEPGMQVYMGNWIDGVFPHLQHNAVALECQHFPDSPNHSDFPSTVLDPSETYKQTTVFAFSLLWRVCSTHVCASNTAKDRNLSWHTSR